MKKTRTNYSQSFKQQVLDDYFQSGMSQTVERLSVEYPHVTMEVLCGLFGKTKQAYYKHKRKQFSDLEVEQETLSIVATYRTEMPVIGGLKLYHIVRSVLGDALGCNE